MRIAAHLNWIYSRQQVIHTLTHLSFHQNLNRFREPDKQQKAMLKAMISDDTTYMALAVHTNKIVGYAIVLPPEKDERWRKLSYLRMLGVIEVAPDYRGHKIGQTLLHNLFKHEELENIIVVSLEYCWHWDLSMTNGDPFPYMHMLKHVLQSSGFEEYETNEPDIACYDVNFLMARVGSRITKEQLNTFKNLAKLY